MTKSELIARLAPYENDDCIIIGDSQVGWGNIGYIKQEGSSICLMQDNTRPFSGDN